MDWSRLRVTIVGGGAMGSLFGGLLAQHGLPVTLVDVWREHVEAVVRGGLRIVGHGGERVARLAATCDPRTVGSADLVLFQCKSFANEAAARAIAHAVGPGTTVISFQNGLGNEETLAALLGAERVLGGVTAQGAQIEAPGVVRTFGDLPSWIGERGGGPSARAEGIAAALSRHGLPTIASPDIRKLKWQKLLGNASLGAASAITGMTSAEMVAVPALRATVLRALDETAAVAQACGIALSEAERHAIFDQLTTTVGGGTGASRSSMAVDLAHRRRTEIDAIHGAVARLGREKGVPTPTLDTLIALVKALEAKFA